MAKDYLTPESPDAFLDMQKKEPRESKTVECNHCHGFGGWHLTINAYGQGRHFNCVCSECDGVGYLAPGEEPHYTRFKRIKAALEGVVTIDKSSYRSTRYSKSVICTLDKIPQGITKSDLDIGLPCAIDGWWSGNFGGRVQEIGDGKYSVTVYTD